MPLSPLQILLLLVLVYLLFSRWRKRAYHLPPGPNGLPILGNVLDMPLDSMGPVYASWAKRFNSDLVSASALGTTLVVIDSYETAVELLEKRAAKYSSRPVSVMACELMGWDCIFAFLPYSDAWRDRRKLFVKHFRPGTDGSSPHTTRAYEFVQRFLLDLNEAPNEFYGLVRHMVGGLAISLAYGLPIQRKHDPLVEFSDSAGRVVADVVTPGKHMVDAIPALKHIPSWLPGGGSKRFANANRWMAEKFRAEPYKKAMAAFGTEGVRPSFLSDALATLEARSANGRTAEDAKAKELDAVLDTACTIFATSADTSTNSILSFIFAIATYPEYRVKVHAELDSVLIDKSGTLRLPTFEDRDSLPLLMAAVMESQRWAPVIPIGIPHRTTEDDEIKGYFIPKGTIVIANQWSMLNNERVYGADPLSYKPERFIRPKQTGDGVEINTSIRHPNTAAFGFGRRSCPGSHIAQSTLWLTAACLLALYEFEAPASEKANYVGPDGKINKERWDPGFVCHPRPFKCEFKPRSPQAEALLAELVIGI